MVKFSIMETGSRKGEIQYLVRELRQKNLIAAVEKDAGGDTVYLTNNLVAVKKIMEDYDNLMLDVHREQ